MPACLPATDYRPLSTESRGDAVAGDREKYQTALTYAEQMSQRGDWDKAIRAYRFALAEFPNDPEAILGFGAASMNAGRIEFAQKAFQQALKLDPGNYRALNYWGDIQERLGQLDNAAETYLRVGNILFGQNELDAAMASWRRAIGLSPGLVDAHQKLANALIEAGRPRQAAKQYFELAETYRRRRNREQAAAQIEAVRQLLGDEPGVRAAFDALEQQKPIQPDFLDMVSAPAVIPPTDEPEYETFSEAFLADDDLGLGEDPFAMWDLEPDPLPKAGLIKAAQQNAMTELANVIFEEGLGESNASISNDEINMLIVQAIDLQSRNQSAEAVSNFQRVIEANRGTPAMYYNLGLLKNELGQSDQALGLLQQAAQSEKYNIPAHFVLGNILYASDNLKQALHHYVEALKLIDLDTVESYKVPELVEYYNTLADNYLVGDNMQQVHEFIASLNKFFAKPDWEKKVYEARRRMDSVVENGSIMSLAEFLETAETEAVITALAVTSEYLQQNLLMTASEECLQAIQKAPFSLLLHIRLAEILLKQNNPDVAIAKYLMVAKTYQIRNQVDKAIGIYKKILRLAPMDVTIRSQLIDLFISVGGTEEALEQYLTLANSYYQLAQVDRAIEKYNDALRLSEQLDDPAEWRYQILEQMGDIYKQRFDWQKALESYEALLALKPRSQRVLRQVIDLNFKLHKANRALDYLNDLINLYQERNQSARILELLQELSGGYPDNMQLRQHLAVAYVQNDMREKAIAEYDALGEMQLERGMHHDAANTIQTILDLSPSDPEGYRRLLQQIRKG